MSNPKEDEDRISLGEQVRRMIEEGIKFWDEFPKKVVKGLPPVNGNYMPLSIKDAVAWLYANIQEEDLMTIKSRGAGGTLHHERGDTLSAYLVAQFRIKDNTDLMEDARKLMGLQSRPLDAYDVGFYIVEVFWKSLHKKRPTG